MSSPAQSSRASIESASGSTWPHQLSHQPSLKVSDVLRVLTDEFPALTPSKLRFFDAQGLVSPQRTASGYRQYSASDVERLRFVLREQRDFYRPLSVIHDALAALDAGAMRRAITPRDAEHERAAFVSAKALAALAGVDEALVDDLHAEGMLAPSVPGGFDRRLATYVASVDAYLAAGGALKEAKLLRHAAQREVERARASARLARSGNDAAAGQASTAARLAAASDLFTAIVEGELD